MHSQRITGRVETVWTDCQVEMNDEKELVSKTESEVTAWSVAGKTAPFAALAGFIACAFFAETWIPFYAVAVIIIWVAVSVAWWWWALNKILRVTRMMLSTKHNFEEVKQELASIKNDMGNRQRRKSD